LPRRPWCPLYSPYTSPRPRLDWPRSSSPESSVNGKERSQPWHLSRPNRDRTLKVTPSSNNRTAPAVCAGSDRLDLRTRDRRRHRRANRRSDGGGGGLHGVLQRGSAVAPAADGTLSRRGALGVRALPGPHGACNGRAASGPGTRLVPKRSRGPLAPTPPPRPGRHRGVPGSTERPVRLDTHATVDAPARRHVRGVLRGPADIGFRGGPAELSPSGTRRPCVTRGQLRNG
jgi:hypothetical protein